MDLLARPTGLRKKVIKTSLGADGYAQLREEETGAEGARLAGEAVASEIVAVEARHHPRPIIVRVFLFWQFKFIVWFGWIVIVLLVTLIRRQVSRERATEPGESG